jgi:oligopeptide transport system substrate-binding protein
MAPKHCRRQEADFRSGRQGVDKLTLEVKTSMPVSFLPGLMSNNNLGALHQASVEKFGKDWTKPGNLVSNGAFVLKEWQVNSKVVIEKNPQYWDAANVQLTRVTYLPVEDGNADVKLFESGQNDWVYQLPPGTYDKYEEAVPQGRAQHRCWASATTRSRRRARPSRTSACARRCRWRSTATSCRRSVTADGQSPAYGVIVKGMEGADVTDYDWAKWPMAQKVAEAKKLLGSRRREARHQVHLLVQHQRIPQEDGHLRGSRSGSPSWASTSNWKRWSSRCC